VEAPSSFTDARLGDLCQIAFVQHSRRKRGTAKQPPP